MPSRGGALFDARYPERTCRISWHPDRGIFSISIWHGTDCIATFQLAQDQVPEFISDFVRPLAETPGLPATGSDSHGGPRTR